MFTTSDIKSTRGSGDKDAEMSTESLRQDFERHLRRTLAKDRYTATDRDRYFALGPDGSRPVD